MEVTETISHRSYLDKTKAIVYIRRGEKFWTMALSTALEQIFNVAEEANRFDKILSESLRCSLVDELLTFIWNIPELPPKWLEQLDDVEIRNEGLACVVSEPISTVRFLYAYD